MAGQVSRVQLRGEIEREAYVGGAGEGGHAGVHVGSEEDRFVVPEEGEGCGDEVG